MRTDFVPDSKFGFNLEGEVERYIQYNSNDPVFNQFIEAVSRRQASAYYDGKKDGEALQDDRSRREMHNLFQGCVIAWILQLAVMFATPMDDPMQFAIVGLLWPVGVFFVGVPIAAFFEKKN